MVEVGEEKGLGREEGLAKACWWNRLYDSDHFANESRCFHKWLCFFSTSVWFEVQLWIKIFSDIRDCKVIALNLINLGQRTTSAPLASAHIGPGNAPPPFDRYWTDAAELLWTIKHVRWSSSPSHWIRAQLDRAGTFTSTFPFWNQTAFPGIFCVLFSKQCAPCMKPIQK